MKVVFLILVHKNPGQVQLLVDYFEKNHCPVFIHIDRKNSDVFSEFVKNNEHKRNVFIYSRYKVQWGSFNQIKATFFLLGEAIKKVEFDFVNLISGQDLPLRPHRELLNFLEAHRESSFLQHQSLPAVDWAGDGGLERVKLFWITGFEFMERLRNKFLVVLHFFQKVTGIYKRWNLPLYGGANWFTLNSEAALYVQDFIKQNRRVFRKFRNSRCADEIILQTILLNSSLKEKIINDSLRYIDWASGPEYPRIFRLEDRARLKTGNAFFGRKFDAEVDAEIIHSIYSNL